MFGCHCVAFLSFVPSLFPGQSQMAGLQTPEATTLRKAFPRCLRMCHPRQIFWHRASGPDKLDRLKAAKRAAAQPPGTKKKVVACADICLLGPVVETWAL